MRFLNLVLGLILCLFFSLSASAERITIAVASNFTAPMKSLVAAFEQTSKHKIRVAYGSSGKFYAQINQGAPFALFFSADQAKVSALIAQGLADEKTRFTYAVGRLVLWSNRDNLFLDGQHFLATDKYNKLALANPRLAPYGSAALEVLSSLGLLQQSKAKWVQGENIAQTYQFIHSGNAELGFVALSQVMRTGKVAHGSYWQVPSQLHQPIKQDAIVLNSAKNSAAAKAFIRFMHSKAAKQIIAQYGYEHV